MTCHLCEGRHTLESLLLSQLSGEARPGSVPVCSAHHSKLESALRDIEAIRTPPVTVNLSAIRLGVYGGE